MFTGRQSLKKNTAFFEECVGALNFQGALGNVCVCGGWYFIIVAFTSAIDSTDKCERIYFLDHQKILTLRKMTS